MAKGISYEYLEVKTESQLFEIIQEFLNEPLNEQKKIQQIMSEMGLNDTIMIPDERTIRLINELDYYSSNATPSAPYDSELWFYGVTIYEQSRLRMF